MVHVEVRVLEAHAPAQAGPHNERNRDTMNDVITTEEACALAQKDGTPADVLTLLASARHWLVRELVAQNPATPPRILRLLADDADVYVRWSAAPRLLSPADRVTFDALEADGWPTADLDGLLATVAALAA